MRILLHMNVERHFLDTRVLKAGQHAVYQCLKKPPTRPLRASALNLKRAFRHARVRFLVDLFLTK